MTGMQISLDKMPIRQSKNFLRAIYNSDKIVLGDWGGKWLDMLDGTQMRRRAEKGMNIEKFLSLNWDKHHLRLQIDSPSEDRIVYCAAIKNEEVTRSAWLDCALTENNYREISLLFKSSYAVELESADNLLRRSFK